MKPFCPGRPFAIGKKCPLAFDEFDDFCERSAQKSEIGEFFAIRFRRRYAQTMAKLAKSRRRRRQSLV